MNRGGRRPDQTAQARNEIEALHRLHGESLRDKLHKAITQLGMTPPDTLERGKLHQFAGKRNQDIKTGFCILKKDNAICGDFDTGVVIEINRNCATRMRIAVAA